MGCMRGVSQGIAQIKNAKPEIPGCKIHPLIMIRKFRMTVVIEDFIYEENEEAAYKKVENIKIEKLGNYPGVKIGLAEVPEPPPSPLNFDGYNSTKRRI